MKGRSINNFKSGCWRSFFPSLFIEKKKEKKVHLFFKCIINSSVVSRGEVYQSRTLPSFPEPWLSSLPALPI